MSCVKDVVEFINILAEYGHHDSANESAAMHALNNAGSYRGRMRARVAEESLEDLFTQGAVFGRSGAYQVCLDVIEAVDDLAGHGVELSLLDAFGLVMGMDSA